MKITDNLISVGFGLIIGFNIADILIHNLTFTNGIMLPVIFLTFYIFLIKEE